MELEEFVPAKGWLEMVCCDWQSPSIQQSFTAYFQQIWDFAFCWVEQTQCKHTGYQWILLVSPCWSNNSKNGFCWWVRNRPSGLEDDEGQPGCSMYVSVVITGYKMRGIRHFSREVPCKWLFSANIWEGKSKNLLLDCKLWFGIKKTGYFFLNPLS